VAGFCECGDKPPGCIKRGKFDDKLRTWYVVKKDSAPCSQLVS
jgi:hypothetical protein